MFTLRKATRADLPAIERVMRASLEGISSRWYDEQQVRSSLQHIAIPDLQLIDDSTYFVAEVDGEVVACGGWSKRAKLYTGSGSADPRLLDPATEPARVRAMFVDPAYARRGIGRAILIACEDEAREAGFQIVELMAMLSGEDLYAAAGYQPVRESEILLEDGVTLGTTLMRKPL